MLVRHTIIYFVGRVAPALITIVSMMIFTRLSTPKEYGTYSLIAVIVGLFNIMVFQWLRSSLLRFYNERESLSNFIGTILKSHLVSMLGIFPLLVLINFIVPQLNFSLSYIITIYIMIAFLSIYELLIIYYRVNLKPKIITYTSVVQALAFTCTSTLLLLINFGVWSFLIAGIISWLLSIVLLMRSIKGINLNFSSSRKTRSELLKYGLPITISFVLSVAMQNIDKIMISAILGVDQNGHFSVSYDLIHNLLYMIMTSFALAGFPLVLQTIKKEGELKGKEQFEKYSDYFFFISIPAAIGLISIQLELTNIIIGDKFSVSPKLLYFIVLASFFHGVKSHYFDLGLQISSRTKYFFYPAFTAMIVNIILNYLLLNKYGIEGAAVATFVAFALAMTISAFYSRKSYRAEFPWKTILKTLFSSMVMYFIVININISNHFLTIIFKVVSGLCIYFLISILLNTVGIRNEIKTRIGG